MCWNDQVCCSLLVVQISVGDVVHFVALSCVIDEIVLWAHV